MKSELTSCFFIIFNVYHHVIKESCPGRTECVEITQITMNIVKHS